MADPGRRLAAALALLLLALPQIQSDPKPQTLETLENALNFVVRFARYEPADRHRSYLDRKLGSLRGWRWIERRNAAAAFPTDFGVVEIGGYAKNAILGAIEGLGDVKDVFLDSSLSRGLFVDEEVEKRPGRIFTSMSVEEGEEGVCSPLSNSSISWNRRILMQRSQVTSLFGASKLWAKGFTGAKVKMAIFDTGIRADHPHFRNIKERTNWTNEDTLNDNLGHGTFVAGVVAGEDGECLGFAPDTEIYAFRVFTDAQVSYTSWFLDAFNYAIATEMDVLNLSIGGPDYLDLPFVEKVWEITANNIIMVSAIGNDGPLYGTLNNPADQSDVIGVGGIDYNDHIASFSSRGMTTWELPHGYGRVKPDVVAYGREIMGSKISTGCKSLSGTSVASPVVAGAVCLLASVMPKEDRKAILNPASMKQALVEGATKLSGPNMYEQGAGRLNLWESYQILNNYQPRASIFPDVLDYSDCPYTWPFCRQPLYAGAMPVIFNATILNGMGVIGYVKEPPTWHPFDELGNLLSIHFTYSDVIWPWTGYLALHMQIKDEGSQFSGLIEGNVTLKVYSPSPQGKEGLRSTTCTLYLKLNVIPTPARPKRVLWDQYHNIKYPPGYIPRDSLDVRNDILDWHGDHLHTNFYILYNMLRDAGYYVETLGSPLTCFDASRYGTLLMVDLEDEYFSEEIEKLRDDVVNGGLGLAVFAEWYNVDSMIKMKFFDDNTRSWWTPITGGANIPALNDLLTPLGIAFGDRILNGDFSINGEQSHYASGTNIVRFPHGGYVHSFELQDNAETGAMQNIMQASGMSKASPILGLVEVGRGRVAVYGDSNCLDSSHMVTNCYWLLKKILDFTSSNVKDHVLFSDAAKTNTPLHYGDKQLPLRRTDVNFSSYSSVIGKDMICQRDTRYEVWGTKGYGMQLIGRNRKLPGYPTIHLENTLNYSVPSPNLDLNKIPIQQNNQNNADINKHGEKDFLGLLEAADEVDSPLLAAGHWMILSVVALLCLLLLLMWQMRLQRRSYNFHFIDFIYLLSGLLLFLMWQMRLQRRRRRRGSGSGRFANSL